MSTSDKIALATLVVAVLALLIPLLISQWYRHMDRRIGLKTNIYPHVYVGPDGKPLAYGMAVEITSIGEEPSEVVNVRIRLEGVDVATSFLMGYSGTKMPSKPPNLKPKDTGIEVELRLEHEGKLLINTNALGGIKITKNRSVRFFTPLPFQPFEIQKLFDTANENQVSVVAHVLPKKDTVLRKGKDVVRTMRACLKAYRGKPVDPAYPWRYGAFTVSTDPPDPWAIGKYNDKGIQLRNEAVYTSTPPTTTPSDSMHDLTVTSWRCEALPNIRLPIQELIAVPQNLGDQFHPQELLMAETEAKELLKVFSESSRGKFGFEMTINASHDPRPLTIRFIREGTAAYALFSLDVDGKPKHMHGLIALLPRIKSADDASAIQKIRQFACLKDIPERAFARAMSDIEPIVAIFFADLGSGNYPPVFATMKLLTAGFFAPAETSA